MGNKKSERKRGRLFDIIGKRNKREEDQNVTKRSNNPEFVLLVKQRIEAGDENTLMDILRFANADTMNLSDEDGKTLIVHLKESKLINVYKFLIEKKLI